MVFRKLENNVYNKILYIGKYHPYWHIPHQVRNREFDHFSSRILDLKKERIDAIKYFFKLLNPAINTQGVGRGPGRSPARRDRSG